MLRIGLFGLGRWGTNIFNTLRLMEGVEVIAFDPAKNLTPLPAIPLTSWDGVIIATPGSTHAAVALPFIKAGVPTYIEKPFTTALTDARRIQRAATQSGAIVFPGHLHRYNPAYLAAKKQVQKGGTIRYLYFEGTNNGPFRDDMAAFWDWAPHDVYLAIDLLNGTLPRFVQAWGIKTLRPETDLYDFSVLKMTWADGREAVSTTSWLLPVKQKKVTVVGERDTVVFDDAAPKKVIVYRGLGPLLQERLDRPPLVEKQEPTLVYPRYSPKPALRLELESFINCIREKKEPAAGLADGVAVVRVLAAAEKSMKLNGKRIKL